MANLRPWTGDVKVRGFRFGNVAAGDRIRVRHKIVAEDGRYTGEVLEWESNMPQGTHRKVFSSELAGVAWWEA